MKKSTQETVSKLYVIRSMLSAISLNHDRVDELKKQKEKKKKEMLPKPNTKSTINVEERKKEWETKIEEKVKERNASNFIEAFSIVHRLVLLFFTALCVFLCFVWVHFDFHFWLGVLFFAIAIPTGVVLLCSIYADLCSIRNPCR